MQSFGIIKMSIRKSILLKYIAIVWILSVSIFVFGQDHVVFEQLTARDGLSNGTINAIFKDSHGFMWFCTDDGLNRFDGYSFKVYKSELSYNSAVKNIQFFSIIEDSYHNIWIGTSDGLYVFDWVNDRIVQFSNFLNIDFSNSNLNLPINCLLFDSYHNLWVGSYMGITRVNITNSDIKTIQKEDVLFFTDFSEDSLKLGSNRVNSIIEDQQKQIWISSTSGQLDHYSYENNVVTQVKIDVPDIEKYLNLAKTIEIDRNNNIWIATRGMGLIHWNRGKQTFQVFKYIMVNNRKVDISFIKAIRMDMQDRLWIGTDGNGLVQYDYNKNKAKHFKNSTDDKSKLSSNAIYSIFEDSSGIIWVGNYFMGVNKFNPHKTSFGAVYSSPNSKNGLSHNLVTGFCEDKNKRIWICTDGGGLNLFDPDVFEFKHYTHEPNNSNSISTNTTITLFCDHENSIWVGTFNGGLNQFNQKTNVFKHYWHNLDDSTSISSNHTWSIVQDKMNNIWVGTVDAGLNLMKAGTSSFIRYQNSNSYTPNAIRSNSITQLFIDSNNNLWIGTEYGLDMVELNRVDFNLHKPKLIFKHYLPNDSVNSISFDRISCINEDKLGNLWIGTRGGGLNKYDVNKHAFTSYSMKDGLPHNIVNGILFDAENNPWVSTNNGLSNFDIKNQKFKNYDLSDGLQSNEFIKTSYLKTSDGMMLFGGINGFNAFYPENIASVKKKLKPLITNFILFNQSVNVGSEINDRVLLPNAIYDLNEITLFHKENSFAFEFSALEFSNAEKIYYSYKLEGFDRDWQITNSKLRIAKYTNLSPGEYTFSVKATMDVEYWTDQETSITVVVNPPWWQTLWFKIVAFFMALIIWFLFFSIRVITLQKQKKILKLKVDEKTAQLEAANVQLSESNIMKDKFLSIVAHDLLNPFNTILGFSELLLNNYSKWEEKTRIETIKTINESSNNLFELLENLLQWSRSERGLLEYFPEKIDLSQCILKSISLQIATAKTKEITIVTDFCNELCIVKSDKQLLNAVIRNLLSNAIKFTPVGGNITLTTETKDGNVIVSIIDTGVGISKDKLNNLFRIDMQHSTSGTNDQKGTGLGLLLVKEFVTKQLGNLNNIN